LKFAADLDIYAELRAQIFERLKNVERGDPNATPEAIFKAVDAENPLLRFFLGNHKSLLGACLIWWAASHLGSVGVRLKLSSRHIKVKNLQAGNTGKFWLQLIYKLITRMLVDF
jgi:hypothetical protein